jgi:hypothetical protein
MSDTSTAIASFICLTGMAGLFFSDWIGEALPPLNGAGGNGDSTCYASGDAGHRGHPNYHLLTSYGVDSKKDTWRLMTQSHSDFRESARQDFESGRFLAQERLWAPAKCHNPQSRSCGKWPRTVYKNIQRGRFPGVHTIQDWERLQGNSNLSVYGKPIDCSMSYRQAVLFHNGRVEG